LKFSEEVFVKNMKEERKEKMNKRTKAKRIGSMKEQKERRI